MNTTRAWGSVRCSSSCSARGGQGVPKPFLLVLVVPGTSPPLFFHHKSKTPRLVKKIKVRLKPSQHMGLFKLGVILCQMCSTFVMSFTPQHDKMSLLEVLPNSLGTEVPAFWLSCYHRPCEMCHSTVSSAGGPEHKCTSWQGPMCLSVSVLSSEVFSKSMYSPGRLGVLHDPERPAGQEQIGLSSPDIQQGKAQVGKI